MKACIASLGLVLCAMAAHAQSTNSFPLWPAGAPAAQGDKAKDIPTLTPFFPEPGKATGAAMVICPGGGYLNLAAHEGEVYARWLNDHGIAGFVIKYRLGPAYHHPVMLQDVTRAVRLVRSKAPEWKIDPKRVGIVGSSAGGHLASTLLTHFDSGDPYARDVVERQSSRPDLGVLCYPVITMGRFTHEGSKENLLGTNASPELVRELSSELQVRKDTPPCFIWATFEDRTVPVENSLQFAAALRQAGVPFALHIYQNGGHGQGLGVRQYRPGDEAKLLPWTVECLDWLKLHGFTK